MIDRLIKFSITHKAVTGFFVLGLIAWGVYSLIRLPIDALPDITNNQVQVHTIAPALAAQEVEQTITSPLEITMASIPGVTEIRSISRFGLSVITIVFKEDMNIYLARELVNQKIQEAKDLIPPGLGTTEMSPISTGLGEIYQYMLRTKPGYDTVYSATDLRTMQDWIVKRQLLGTPGVAEINSFGGYIKQYEVAVNPEKLRSMNITLKDIFTALEQNNQNTGGAYIEKAQEALFIRGVGLVKTLEDVRNIVIKNNEGIPVLIRNVAEIRFGSSVRYGAMTRITRNSEGEVVGGIVLMLKGENSSQVIERVKEKIATIQKTLPEGVVIEPYLDRSQLISRAISTVSRNLLEGGLIVIFILVLMLGNLRAGLIVASVIPLSLLFAVSMMNLFGVSGNLMSLGAIDFGLIVDGAVIIVESIVHRIHHTIKVSGNSILTSQQMDDEVFASASRIRKSAAFGEIIILMVYIPILTLVGIEGKMFRPMAQTVSFAILGALVLSLTYVPMISALFLDKKISFKRNLSDRIMDFLHRQYEPVIHFALRRKRTVIIVSFVLFAVSVVTFGFLGGEFIPTLEEGDFAVETRLAAGSSLSQTIATTETAGQILLKNFPEVKEVVCRIGVADIPTDPDPIETSMMMILLKDKSEWITADNREELADKMKEALSVIPGVNYEFQQPIQLRFNELISGIRQDVAVKIYGDDLDVLAQLGNKAATIISGVDGAVDVLPEVTMGMPQITVEYHREKIARYGLTISDVNKVLESAFAGAKAGVVYEGEKRFDLVVRLDKAHRAGLSDVKDLYVSLPDGNQIPLSEVASVTEKEGPSQISRDDTKRRIVVGLNVRGRNVQSVVADIQKKLGNGLKLPPGYYIAYGGQFKNLVEARNRLMVAVPIALAIIFVLLFFTFGSFRETLLIFSAIPLSAIGGVFALLVRGMPFSISAGVGFIALFGVAVLNGIVLVSYFNQLEKEGITDIRERILQGVKVRLRPVVMTAAVASFGFLPMAISTSAGAEVQRPLATVVIGGLITATFLTLIVLPVLYSIFMQNFSKKKSIHPGNITTLALLLTGLSLPAVSNAQTSPAQQTQPLILSVDDAIKIATENNPVMKSANYSITQQEALKKTAFDIGKTTVGYSYDNTVSPFGNKSYDVSQSFRFPTVFFRQAKLQNQQVTLAQDFSAITQSVLVRNVKSAWYQWVYGMEKLKLLSRQAAIFHNYSEMANIRFKNGETNYLEKISAQATYQEVLLAQKQAEKDIEIYKQEMQKLLNINQPFQAKDTVLMKLPIASLDTGAYIKNPGLEFYRQKTVIAQTASNIEKSNFLPDISLGYSIPVESGVHGFYGYQLGVSIPLWFRPQQGRVQAASLGVRIAEADAENYRNNIRTAYNQQLDEIEKLTGLITFYETVGIRQADEILKTADNSYKTGQIGYVEYSQNISQAISIKSKYIDTLNQYNQAVITMSYIIGTY